MISPMQDPRACSIRIIGKEGLGMASVAQSPSKSDHGGVFLSLASGKISRS